MIRRIMILAAGLTLVAGCHNRKPPMEKAPAATDDHETVGEFGEKVAVKTSDAADATIAEGKRVDDNAEKLGENTAEATRDAADDTLKETDRAEEKLLGSNETLPPERGVDIPENGIETPNPEEAEEDVIAEKPAESIGTAVTASVDSVDRKKKRLTFRIKEGVEEISLQSGKEILVPFMDLRLLTGMSAEKAIEALQESGDVQVRVFGKGDSMRIVAIDME